MATTTIRESTILRATDYLNHIRRLVEKNASIPVSEMKKEATKMHVGTTYIDQAIALGYFKKNDKGQWKVSLAENADFTLANARAMVEKSNEYNRQLMRARSKKAAESKVVKKVSASPAPVRSAASGSARTAPVKPVRSAAFRTAAAKAAAKRVARSRRIKATVITDKYIERYLSDKIILEQFMKKHLISNLEVCALTSELRRRGLVGTLSGSIQV